MMYPTPLLREARQPTCTEPRNVTEALGLILTEMQQMAAQVQPQDAEAMIRALETAHRIYTFGAGRSGYVLRTFCMRLMQLGFTSYYIGETITPRIQPGDLLVVMSGSGETAHTRELVRQAKAKQVRTLALTAHPHSSIGREADLTLVIRGTTKLTLAQEEESFQCPGSLFEQAAFLLCEAVVMLLLHRHHRDNKAAVLDRHADLE